MHLNKLIVSPNDKLFFHSRDDKKGQLSLQLHSFFLTI